MFCHNFCKIGLQCFSTVAMLIIVFARIAMCVILSSYHHFCSDCNVHYHHSLSSFLQCKIAMFILCLQTVLCPLHLPKVPADNELANLSVFRRVYVNREENKQVASIAHHEDKKFTVRVGALVFHHIGQLLPHQIQSGKFNTRDFIYPVSHMVTCYCFHC